MSKNKESSKRTALILGLVSAALLVGVDQWTKLLANVHLRQQPSVSLIPGVLELHYLFPENRGIAFGMFQGSVLVFAAFSLVIMGVLVYFYVRTPTKKQYIPLMGTLILMFSGAAGNFIDRVFRGYVIDFIYISLINFPVFNVADIFVVTSGVLLVILVCFVYKDEEFEFYSWKRKEK